MTLSKELEVAIKNYQMFIEADYQKTGHNVDFKTDVEVGRNYARVIICNGGSSRSSHSFVVVKPTKGFVEGDILMSASWKAPATNFKRGNVLNTEFDRVRWAGCF